MTNDDEQDAQPEESTKQSHKTQDQEAGEASDRRVVTPEPIDMDDGSDPEAKGEAPTPLEEDDEDPQSPQGRLDALESELAALREEQEETKKRWLRALADYDNLVRRTEKERDDQKRNAAARLIGDLLSPLEILERAAKELAEVDDAHAKGIRLALGEMKATLAREGLEEVPGAGEAFDAKVHEAVAREPADAPEGTILEVVRPGYTLHGRLLRAALVKVSSGSPEPTDAS